MKRYFQLAIIFLTISLSAYVVLANPPIHENMLLAENDTGEDEEVWKEFQGKMTIVYFQN
ncbi:MAG: hypothetical protein R2827_00395 [Bdellovibrionales bacterium]